MRHPKTRAFTIVELLIVITILALLIQFILPAVAGSRESARRLQCGNNIRQLGLAFQLHHDAHGHFPTSGWGWQWVGHPDRGFGDRQPGGWAYNILPFIEQQGLRSLGAGLPDGSREQAEAILQVNATPLEVFVCPSRRIATTWPLLTREYSAPDVGFSPLLPDRCRSAEGVPCRVARSDYAANAGNINDAPGNEPGPSSLKVADDWAWRFGAGDEAQEQNGVTYQRSDVTLARITDGASHTYCLSERFIPPEHYETGEWINDNHSLYVGHDGDSNIYTSAAWKEGGDRAPGADNGLDFGQHHGSAHSSSFNVAFCDGSVQPVAYDIDPEVHRLRGGRDDDQLDPVAE